MGMDLDPSNKGVGGFHANWVGWEYIGTVLRLAGADTSKMSGSNEGDYVDGETAQSWGRAVERVLPKLRDMHFLNPIFSDGYAQIPLLVESYEHEVALRLKSDRKITKLDDDTVTWLKEFIKFCVESGGFRQF